MRVLPRTFSSRRLPRQRSQPVFPNGQPPKELSVVERMAVLEKLHKEGVHLGLSTLRVEFPRPRRCELRDLQADYRRYYRATKAVRSNGFRGNVP